MAAEAWGRAPWEVANMDGEQRIWFWRYLAWREACEERMKNG